MKYKLYNIPDPVTKNVVATGIMFVNENLTKSFLMDESNTDYANFKKEILADEAQLQDAEGDTMSAAAAKEYIATLP